jgi:hypothetical protein
LQEILMLIHGHAKRRGVWGAAMVVVVASWASVQAVIRVVRPIHNGPSGTVNLPYNTSDNQGNQWMVYQPSMIQMQGNNPVYSQAAQITINGNQPQLNANQARVDDKTGELVMENMRAANFILTRRLEFNAEEGYVRVIDIIKNPQAQEQQLNLRITSNVNFGIQSATLVPDPKKKDQNIAWVAQTNNGRAAVDVYGGQGSKVVPSIHYPQGNNFVQATLNLAVPGNKEVAFVHFHATAANQDAGVQWVNSMKESELLADVPKDLRKIIVNFKMQQSQFGDLEVLRGDVLDVVELRSGDKFNGNLTETSYKLDTFYGTVELPVDKVIGILNTGMFRPRQLVVTGDGQIFGGHLEKPTIDLELSSGQKTQIPLSQISRVGYRHRAGESADASTDQTLQPPYVLMNSGDRVGVTMPTTPIAVVTRYGSLQLSPDMISSIAFTSEESGVHTFYLIDGSKFAGLVTAPEFDMKLTTGTKDQVVKFPTGELSRLVLKNRPEDADASAPSLQLKKDDVLVGTLTGELKLDTAFDTITVNAAEIKGLTHPKEDSADVSIATWDGAVFSGQLQSQDVACHLGSGLDMHVPVALVQAYVNPQSQAPAMMIERIKAIVADLNADDWKQRDAAEKQLVNIGPGVAATLKGMRDKQTPEAQQRIDSVLKQLEKAGAKETASPAAAELNKD